MKSIFYLRNKKIIFPVLLFIFFCSCETLTNENNLGGTFQIMAKVLNPQDSINLGDSLKILFEIPDTIKLQGGIYNVGDSSTEIILTDKISCSPYEKIEIADSTTTGGVTLATYNNSCKIYTNPGYFNNDVLNLVKYNNRLYSIYYLIPQKKGVFMLSNWTLMGGYFSGMSSKGMLKCRVVFDFDVADKHHYLLQPAIGVNNDLTTMINEKESHGEGVYVFEVK